jgi:hypothetical protein
MQVRLRYPTTLWLSSDEVPDGLHAKAARYDPGDDILTINPVFPVYLAQLDRLLEEHGGESEAGAIITEKLRQWWELTLRRGGGPGATSGQRRARARAAHEPVVAEHDDVGRLADLAASAQRGRTAARAKRWRRT